MSTSMSTHGRATDSSFAPHPLHEAEPARAARFAEGASPRAPSAPTIASEIARAVVEAAVLAMLVLNVAIWAGVLSGRV